MNRENAHFVNHGGSMNQKYKSEESRIALAREIAGEAMVLLKN